MRDMNAAQKATGTSVAGTQTEPEAEGRLVIETRFGRLEFGDDNRLHMPIGMLGFSALHSFGLAELPQPQLASFKLLQCLDDTDLSFIVTPLRPNDGRVAHDDLEDAALSVGIPVEAAAFLLIVTLRQTEKGTSVTVNLRAPVVVDVNRALARQVVMANSSYPIQQPLDLAASNAA